jgi:hypothetical protein
MISKTLECVILYYAEIHAVCWMRQPRSAAESDGTDYCEYFNPSFSAVADVELPNRAIDR